MKSAPRPRQDNFQTVMVPYMDMLYSYALYLTTNRETANDLLQDTFLKAYRFFDKFEQGTNAKAWLYRIMRNTFINEYRRIKRLPDMVQYDEQISSYQMLPRDEDEQPGDLKNQLDGELFDDEIAVAISTLPEKFKSVIVLRDVEDLPYEDIADALEIPVGTVRSRLHRARAILYAKLKDYAKTRGYQVGDGFVLQDIAFAH